jgi:hypothetical protein
MGIFTRTRLRPRRDPALLNNGRDKCRQPGAIMVTKCVKTMIMVTS